MGSGSRSRSRSRARAAAKPPSEDRRPYSVVYRCPIGLRDGYEACKKRGGKLGDADTVEQAKEAVITHLTQSTKHKCSVEEARQLIREVPKCIEPWTKAEWDECYEDEPTGAQGRVDYAKGDKGSD